MAESLAIGETSARVKTRNAYLRMKNCSPKFKTVLRQRYRERVERNRMKILDGFRNADVSNVKCWQAPKLEAPTERDILKQILENDEDFNLDEELLLEESIDEELSQFENWLLREYDSCWEESQDVIVTCPLCCSGHFECSGPREEPRIFCRKCGSSYSTDRSLLHVQNDIFTEVDSHKSECTFDPAFVNVPGGESHSNLTIICDKCAYLQIII